MVDIPAVCAKCGAFFPSGYVFESVTNLTLSGNLSGPCPNCGGMGRVLDGVFNIIGDSITLLSGPQRTIDQLRRLAEILERAKQEGASRDEIVTKLEEEGLSSLADVIPKEGLLIPKLVLLILAINTLINYCSLKATEPTVDVDIDSITIQQSFSEEEKQQLINEVLEKVMNLPSSETPSTPEQLGTPDDIDDPDNTKEQERREHTDGLVDN